ncbi:NAD(P)/FAD-dependent oxidoreductase [Actinomycetospora sp. TBRC 11914]|uniref:NAD(P)/FAD-dependent oxidoreductase n=1 Tax=Actinomycetospora sp. TBRC 11914 TaxID=2729387 RepID=UPI00145FCAB2|nr:FAD-dependent oxidoreductase [Actinomycetospora sp. TBRC 11914]NMO89418.1 NAD(P)-binding protein [Actinomycetospora sp. TBRC 11914]
MVADSGVSPADPSGAPHRTDVLVVGAGISGIACARALTEAGVAVRVLERAGHVGGRLASPDLPRGEGAGSARPVDLGAAYFTVSGSDEPGAPEFAALVSDWDARGLARPWTDTLAARDGDGTWEPKRGPQRWAAPGGLRSLVADLARGLRVETHRTVTRVTPGPAVDDEAACAVVLAMPDPQAARLVEPPLRAAGVLAGREWEPVIAVALGYGERGWRDDFTAAFVNGHPDLSLIADDGARRGDRAPVLVAHTTGDLARRHLDDPDAVVPTVVDAVGELLGLEGRPAWTHAHRWTYASPAQPHDAAYHLDDDLLAVVGDAWGSPKVETAWRSGTLLGRALAARVSC